LVPTLLDREQSDGEPAVVLTMAGSLGAAGVAVVEDWPGRSRK